jgi:co-chaperonin GroES (HSP10)
MKVAMSKSGIWPAGDRVLVKPDPIDDGIKTQKIELPDFVKAKYEQAQATGTLIAVGPDAFSHVTENTYVIHDGGREELVEKKVRGYSQPFANVGDRVAFAKYSGLRVKGADGESYIILNDEDITAKVSDEVEFTELDTRKALGAQERV